MFLCVGMRIHNVLHIVSGGLCWRFLVSSERFFSNNVDITIIAQVWTQTKLGTDCDKKIRTYGNVPC